MARITQGEKEMEKLLKKVNKRRMNLDLPEILTDGRGSFVRQNRKGKFVKI